MKKQRSLLIVLILFLVILIGAYLLYSNLASDYKQDSLLAVPDSDSANLQSNEPETDAYPVPDASPETAESENDQNASAPEDTTYAAPDFTVYDADGNAVKLSDFIGKPVVLNFWASWCGPCKSEMPEFEEAYKEHGSDIHFVIVNLTDGSRETTETARAFIDTQGYTFPVYYDTDIDAAMQYAVSSIPATYFIDADGNLTAYGIGALDGATLAKGIDMITGEK